MLTAGLALAVWALWDAAAVWGAIKPAVDAEDLLILARHPSPPLPHQRTVAFLICLNRIMEMVSETVKVMAMAVGHA